MITGESTVAALRSKRRVNSMLMYIGASNENGTFYRLMWRRQFGYSCVCHTSTRSHSTCFQPMLENCCAYSCTQYSLHTQYMLLTHADDLLCLQLHTVGSPYTVHAATHADDLLCLQLHTVGSPHTVHASSQCWKIAVPTAAHSTVSIHSTRC